MKKSTHIKFFIGAFVLSFIGIQIILLFISLMGQLINGEQLKILAPNTTELIFSCFYSVLIAANTKIVIEGING